MMQIPTAKCIVGEDIKIIALHEMTKSKYEGMYKGKLFCPTETCLAKVSFCSGDRKAHYKTWPFSKHAMNCSYHPNNSRNRTITRFGRGSNSKNRKQEAVMRAYKSMLQLETNEPVIINSKNKSKKNKNPRKTSNYQNDSIQMKLFDEEIDEKNSKVTSNKLLSRFVDEISEADIGETRLIKGFVIKVSLIDSVAEIIIDYNNEQIKVVFEERFKNEPLNKSYLSKFWAIKELLNRKERLIFTGVGEVSEVENGEYQLSIWMGTDFKLNGGDLYTIARRMQAEILM